MGEKRQKQTYAERLAKHDEAVDRATRKLQAARDKRQSFIDSHEARARALEARAADIRAAVNNAA